MSHPDSIKKTRPSPPRRIAFPLIGLALSVIALEIVLQIAALASPQIAAVLDRHAGMTVPDGRLVHRPSAAYTEHDTRGFRNGAVPERAFAVALGDSQTYGAMVPREDAWPQQLGTALGKPVYNMAFGGYGAGEALILLDEAFELKPEWVLYGLYTGNDLFDAYELVYKTGSLDAQRSDDQEVLRAIADAAAGGTIQSAFDKTHTPGAAIKQWFGRYSKVYGLARAARNALRGSAWQETDPEWDILRKEQRAHPDWEYIEHGEISTILTPEYRLLALDRTDPRIREGERITLALLPEIAKRCAESGARFAVVALPTKELVYEPLLTQSGFERSGKLDQLWLDETAFWRECQSVCEKHGILFVDTLAALRDSLSKGDRPFRRDSDGHLTPLGNGVVSNSIATRLNPE